MGGRGRDIHLVTAGPTKARRCDRDNVLVGKWKRIQKDKLLLPHISTRKEVKHFCEVISLNFFWYLAPRS